TVGAVMAAVAMLALWASAPALAQTAGQPTPWGLGMQESVTEVMHQIRWFETYTLVIITVTLSCMPRPQGVGWPAVCARAGALAHNASMATAAIIAPTVNATRETIVCAVITATFIPKN
ncbi:MAG: hypothetical protein AAGF49_13175, partial [Pseudomonadota bacterium]